MHAHTAQQLRFFFYKSTCIKITLDQPQPMLHASGAPGGAYSSSTAQSLSPALWSFEGLQAATARPLTHKDKHAPVSHRPRCRAAGLADCAAPLPLTSNARCLKACWAAAPISDLWGWDAPGLS